MCVRVSGARDGDRPTCQRGELVQGFVKHWREKQNRELQCCPLLSLRRCWSVCLDALCTLSQNIPLKTFLRSVSSVFRGADKREEKTLNSVCLLTLTFADLIRSSLRFYKREDKRSNETLVLCSGSSVIMTAVHQFIPNKLLQNHNDRFFLGIKLSQEATLLPLSSRSQRLLCLFTSVKGLQKAEGN